MIAQDPLSLVFIFCFLLGFGFFIVSALMGSHGHGHGGAHAHVHIGGHAHGGAHAGGHASGHAHGGTHASSSHAHASGQHASNQQQAQSQQAQFSLLAYLSPTPIALFLLGFGFFGYFFHNTTSLAASLTLLLASGGGLVIAAMLLLLLNRLFANAEGSTEQDVVDRTGMLGKVSITIPEKGLGEIIYTSPGGMRKSIPARGLDGQRMGRDLEVVVVNYQNGVAEVDSWEHFMQEEANTPDPSTLDELERLRSLLNASDPAEMEMVMRQEKKQEE